MAQTDYSTTPPRAMAGMPYDARRADRVSAVNAEASAAMPFGMMVRQGASEREVLACSAAGQLPAGIVLHKHKDPSETAGITPDDDAALLKRGAVWVRVEEAIALGDRVFYRHTTAGAEEAGEFRNDADGVAQVATGTPTPADSTLYELDILVRNPSTGKEQFFHFEYTSDTDGTATEICDGFRTAMQANSAFDALVGSTGTTTLILTAAAPDITFDVLDVGAGVMAIAATTAAAPDCDELPSHQARWLGPSITVDGVLIAPLELNL